MLTRKTAAWLIHFYTALGGVIGMLALFAAAQRDFNLAFILLFITILIDATDGLMARQIRIKEVLPNFDGSMVDNVIDVLTYIWIPTFIIATIDVLPHIVWITVPVLAGLYAYGQTEMKTDDNFFLGFPSYWNIVALYMYWLRPEPVWAVLMLVIPGILTFIPTRYLYPSRNRFLARPMWLLGGLWFLLCFYLLLQEQPPLELIWLSTIFPIIYAAASFYIDWKIRRGHPY